MILLSLIYTEKLNITEINVNKLQNEGWVNLLLINIITPYKRMTPTHQEDVITKKTLKLVRYVYID